MIMKINGKEINQKEFAFEGCHKFYLLSNEEEKRHALEHDYEVLPIEELEYYWDCACSLRFISTWDLKEQIVKQFENAVFKNS